MFAQDGQSIIYVKKNQNLFILDVTILRKIMQANEFTIISTGQKNLIYLVSCIKKVQIDFDNLAI